MKLYEISREIEDALLQDEEAFNPAQLESLKVEFEAKLEGCACVIKNLRAESEALCSEIKRLQARKAAIDNNARGLREYVKFQLERVNIKRLNAGIHKFRIQRNSQPSVSILDASLIHDDYKRIKVEIDRKAIGDNFRETGEIPPGTDIHVDSHLRVS